RRRREENDGRWRRRREREDRIVEDENRPPDVDDFFRRWRRQGIGDGRERRRRLEGGGKEGQRGGGVGRGRAPRVTPRDSPIGRRGVDDATSPPRDRLAPGGNDGAHSRSHRIVGIGGDEFRIAVQRVALQRRGIGFLRGQIANRPRADRGRLFVRNGGRRRVG